MTGFDIDGVLYPWHEATFEYYQRLGKVSDSMTYDEFWSDWWWKKSELFQNNTQLIQTLYEIYPPKKGLIDFLKEFGRDIIYITARPLELERVTRRYFKRYDFPNADYIIFSSNKEDEILYYNVDTFVEDNYKTANSVSKHCKTYLVNKPWNRDKGINEGIIRINDVLDLREFLYEHS